MVADTGAQLRSLYKPQGGVGEIFSAKVSDYVASRPDYPGPLFDMLHTRGNLSPASTIADVGAGTGLLTQELLRRGYSVLAVEPNGEMRCAADRLLSAYQRYLSVCGSAESMPIESFSVDLVTVAQAFHWFERDKAKAECLRVLRPQGQVALIWNDRVLTDPLHVALDDVFARYGGAKRGALVAHEERHDVPKFFGVDAPQQFSWPHEHRLNEAGVLSLVFSRSYMPDRDSRAGKEASDEVRDIFAQYASGDTLSVRYTTVAIIGRPQ